VDSIIKKETGLKENYANKEEKNEALMAFLVYYMLYRRHGGVRKELGVKTPFQAVEKWFMLKPEIFNQNPLEFKNKILNLKQNNKSSFHKQRCET
jgi:hypothetical protein